VSKDAEYAIISGDGFDELNQEGSYHPVNKMARICVVEPTYTIRARLLLQFFHHL